MNYCRGSVKFAEKPDYQMLRKLFKEGLVKLEYQYDYKYDWTILAKKRKKELE